MKTAVRLFFLPLLVMLPLNEARAEIQTTTNYKINKIHDLGNVTAFDVAYSENPEFYIAEDIGMRASKNRAEIIAFRISRVLPDNSTEVILERTSQPVMGVNYNQGVTYITSRGRIHRIAKGNIYDVITSLPTNGDHGNSKPVFAGDFMYVAVGTATNSGIIGPDNTWLPQYPSLRDIPCQNVNLSGVSIESDNFLTARRNDTAKTVSFTAYNTPVSESGVVYGMKKCSGSILKINPKNSVSEVFAWGFRNPKSFSVDDEGSLWLLDAGMENRGVRPVSNGRDALYKVSEKLWYGWPDFSAGAQADQPAVLAVHPNSPPQPVSDYSIGEISAMLIAPDSFSQNTAIAQIGDKTLVNINLSTGSRSDILTLDSGRIVEYKFGPDKKLYILMSSGSDKTTLYSVEPSVSLISAAPISAGRTGSSMNFSHWLTATLLSLTAGAGYYVIRNFRYPLKPL